MSPAAARLRPTSAPTRVSELLLPTVLSLLNRNPAGAAFFATLLPPAKATASHGGRSPGTRVTAQQGRRPGS